MSRIFVTSDIHLFHKSIIKFCPESRPFIDIDDMHNNLINNWNSVIGENDKVFILGDITFGKVDETLDILNQLNGREKILIKGNHDQQQLKNVKFRNYFKEIHDYYELKYNKETICMFHYPISYWNKKHYGAFHLYGHRHLSYQELIDRSMDIGMDSNKCMPYLLDDVIRRLGKITLPILNQHK